MLKKVILDERGLVLVWTLVILGIGALLIPPLLSYINTNLLASRTIEEGLKEQYAADAGVEYALHRLANDDCPDVPFDTPTPVNNMPVTVTVESEDAYYKITSTAKGTVIRSYVEYSPGGNLDIYKGALVSETGINLHKECTVDGDILYDEDYSFTAPDLVLTEGSSVVSRETVEFPDSDEFAQTYKDEAMEGGTHWDEDDGYDLIIPQHSIISLGPLYIRGDLKVEKECEVTLEGTIYVEGGGHMAHDIDVDKSSLIRGEGSIVAEGDIYLGKMADYGTDTDAVIMSVYGNITFKKEADVRALIYAPDGSITFDKSSTEIPSTVCGGVLGGYIDAKMLNLFAYDATFYDGFELPSHVEARFKLITYDINP